MSLLDSRGGEDNRAANMRTIIEAIEAGNVGNVGFVKGMLEMSGLFHRADHSAESFEEWFNMFETHCHALLSLNGKNRVASFLAIDCFNDSRRE